MTAVASRGLLRGSRRNERRRRDLGVDLGAPGVQFSALIVRGRPVSPVLYVGTQAGAVGGLYKGLLISSRAYLPLATR
jgi:hypothetical protein